MIIRIRNLRTCLLSCAKFVVSILIFHALEFTVIFSFHETVPQFDLHQCYLDELPGIVTGNWSAKKYDKYMVLEDVLLSDIKPIPGKAIFFIETKSRQACSIESAARHHPNFQVFVLLANSKVLNVNNPVLNALKSYNNVHLRHLNIWRYVKDTPVEDWIIRDNQFLSRFPTEHTSDLLRLLTVYRFGGIYMDMDVVVLRSLEKVPLNYLGVEFFGHISNAVISLEPTGIGHEIGELFLRNFQQNFNGANYSFNGPLLIKRVMSKICATNSIKEMINNPRRCHGLQVFNASAFFILQHESYFFDPRLLGEALEKTKNSYIIHLWNKGSKSCILKVGSNAAYGRYAAQHCPRAYAAAGDYF